MGKCGKEPASPREEEEQSPRSLSSLLDVRGFRSDVVVLLGSDVLSSGKQRLRFMTWVLVVALATHVLSECAWEYRGLRVFRVSYDGGVVEKGQPEQVHAWSSFSTSFLSLNSALLSGAPDSMGRFWSNSGLSWAGPLSPRYSPPPAKPQETWSNSCCSFTA